MVLSLPACAMSISEGTGRSNFSLVGWKTLLTLGAAFLTTFFATTFFGLAFTPFLLDFVLVAISSPQDYI